MERTKSFLRKHIEFLLDIGTIDLNDVVAVLTEIEGWGRQQIYLYKWNGGITLRDQWLDPEWVERRFEQNGLSEIFNTTRPITESNSSSSLFTIQYPHNKGTIRFVWVQNRSSFKRLKSKDPQPPDFEPGEDGTSLQQRIVLHAFLETIVRDVTSFEWDIKSGEAMIMIRKLRGVKYADVRNRIESELADIVPIKDFERLRTSKLIDNLDDVEDIIRPRMDYRSLYNPDDIVSFKSGRRQDIYSNPIIALIRQEYKDDFNGYGGFSQWKIDNSKYIGVDLYAKKQDDHRIGIRSEELEKDVRHVLQRIRPHCE